MDIAFGFGILNERKGTRTSAIEVQNIRWGERGPTKMVERLVGGRGHKRVVDMAFKKQTKKEKKKRRG